MGVINIHNYEAYLLDFSEGNLSGEIQMELELFLIQNSQLNIELSELSLISLEKEEVCFLEKKNLKKSESHLVSETQFISYIENQLPTNEKLNVEKSCLTNPLLAKEFRLYQHTIAVTDNSIIYPNKNELKRRTKVIWFNFSTAQFAAAACILFLIGVFILWPRPASVDFKTEIAERTKRIPVLKNNPTSFQNKGSNAKEKKIEQASIVQITKPQKSSSLSQEELKKETDIQKTNESSQIEEPNKNETLIASNPLPVISPSKNAVVEVITENEEEPFSTAKKKKGLWAIASKALKNLNQVGVKSVNGNEDENKDKTSYALTLGGINITHKAGNL